LIVVDASVALQWVVRERTSAAMDAVLLLGDLIAPDLMLIESGNALRRKVALGEIDAAQAHAGLNFIAGHVAMRRVGQRLVHRAMEMASEMGHPIYDCIYAALAEDRQALLNTNDAELVRRMRRVGLSGLTYDLGGDTDR
jgi:predicted nucleic acid-binding protein